jgi:hypothetical protein
MSGCARVAAANKGLNTALPAQGDFGKLRDYQHATLRELAHETRPVFDSTGSVKRLDVACARSRKRSFQTHAPRGKGRAPPSIGVRKRNRGQISTVFMLIGVFSPHRLLFSRESGWHPRIAPLER